MSRTCEICGEEIPKHWVCTGYCSEFSFHVVHLHHENTPEFEEWCKNISKPEEQCK